MKKLLLLFSMILATLVSNAQGQGSWISQSSGFTPVSSGVRNVSVVDTNIVWITPYDGDPLSSGLPRQDFSRTIDGGNTWVAGTVPIPNIWDWAMIDGLDANNAWAIFFDAAVSPVGLGQIWHTSNGGTNWTRQGVNLFNVQGQSFPNIIHFWNDTVGVVVGDPINGNFEIYTTDNGGTTWDSVPVANIPPALDASENGWSTHLDVVGDTIWFDTNERRVYRSIDHGHHWTVSNTNLPSPSPGGSIDVRFYNHLNGIARYYNDTTITNDVVESTDGGNTWGVIATTGNFFGADFDRVPGVNAMYVSTGVSNTSGFTGSSYSIDGGHTWLDIESGTQRNALGIADSLTMWCGGFTTSPTSDGIFKYVIVEPVPCTDTSISPGITSASDTVALCANDSVFVTSTGVYSPVNGTFSGVSWVISTGDISGSANPLQEFSLAGSYRITFPAQSTDTRLFINDGLIVDGINVPYGMIYFTPVVFGNATGTSPVFLGDLTLDPSCTFTGNSIGINVLNPQDPICTGVGIAEIDANQLSIRTSITNRNLLDVFISSASYGKMSLEVMDITGRIVKTSNSYVNKGNNHETMNVEDLASGTYIVKAEVNGIRATKRVVKY